MKLELKRVARRSTYTIGKLYIDGVYFSDTLEDRDRDLNHDGDINDVGEEKVMNETCIPSGTYQVIINWSNRFKRLMPLLVNVPGFEGIRIHNGITDKNTSGCLLVGKNSIVGQLTQSKEVFDSLFYILSTTKEPIKIVIL
jgi:hypothetical protein